MNSKSIDHGSMRVCSDNGVVIEETVLLHDDACKILKVHLMDNTGAWWHDLEVVEGLGAPFQELESLPIPIELDDLVLLGSVGGSEHVSLDGVIDDQIDWAQWIDFRWVTSEPLHGISHGCEVDDGWHTTIGQNGI